MLEVLSSLSLEVLSSLSLVEVQEIQKENAIPHQLNGLPMNDFVYVLDQMSAL